MDNYYVYILKCSDGTLYTGSTNNLTKRLASHNGGQGARYTRARLPVTMEYTEGPLARGDALRREVAIKALSREKKLALIGRGMESPEVAEAEIGGAEIGGVEMKDVEPELSLERLGGWPDKVGKVGTLYLVATPIGNLEDITLRALRVLKEADLIAAEDTRHTRKLLTHFDIAVPLTSYHQHNRHSKGEKLMEMLELGKNIALVTDAGMPGISDPGHDLVESAWQRDVPAVVVPGASAGLVALVASGLDTTTFIFKGFLSQDNKERREQLKDLERTTVTSVIYEAPHRLCKTLRELALVLGERQIAVARELTKKYEEVLRGSAVELEKHFKDKGVKGEFVLVIQGAQPGSILEEAEWWAGLSIVEHVAALVKQNFDKKESIKQVAKCRNLPKREVYQMIIDIDKA